MKYRPLVLAALMTSAAISGCTQSPEPSSVSTGTDTPSKYKDKLDLKLFLAVAGGANDANLPQGDKDFVKKAIEQKFNVSLNVQFMPIGADRTNKTNLLVASGDVPDLFISTGTDSQKYILDNVVADMTPFINPQTMPNYFKWVSEVELKRYAVENTFKRAPIPFARNVYRSYYIRKDWLDKLNLKVPANYDEMMNAMRAFTNNDPDGNSKKDTFGFSTVGNGNTVSTDFPQYLKHGLVGAFMVENNKLTDVSTDLRMEGVLNDIKAMIKEGIVDPDWFLSKGTAYLDKAAQGKVGVIASGERTVAFDSNPTSLQNKTKALFPNARWVPFHPYASAGVWTENLPNDAFLFSKATAEKSPEKIKRIVDIVDWLCGEEGFLLTHYGVEGKHYTKNGKQVTLKPEAIDKEIVTQGNFLAIYGSLVAAEPEVLGLEVIDPRMTDNDRAILKTIKGYKLLPSIGTNVAPPQGFNLADFRTKMREYHVKILFDEQDASNWPKYREELMTKYRGGDMLKTYEDQMRAAGVIK
ncbi:extracellular solute-binding protein [Paenibacillus sp. H1-7]|uniref:extracellular solute-binding protein n=1 Tax=Paenibacillus sp. H1-7 TaxID=2282849 RepID=UPI001EF8DECB|nr:extracellular solute-binding protein [Paenibacillus sp. H1-7]ULL16045.1 extracellular solute-binding protein [Paenibacillus sp. H1-7]